MLKPLIKKQLLEIYSSFFRDRKTGQRRKKTKSMVFVLMLAVLMASALGQIFFYLANQMSPLILSGLGWFYFVVMGIIALAVGVFGSVFSTFAMLYQAKDNDLLLSLPIPPSRILISRLVGVYIMGLMYSGIVFVPAVIVYYMTAEIGVANAIGPVALTVIISLIVLILSCLLGWLVAKINNKLRNKNIITVIASLAFMAAYFFVYSSANRLLSELLANSAAIGSSIKSFAYPLYAIGMAGEGHPLYLLGVAAVTVGLLCLVWAFMSKSFLKLAAGSKGNDTKVKYVKKENKQGSPASALLKKELSRFLSSPTYMLNCGLGTILLVVGAVAVLIKGGDLYAMLAGFFVEDLSVIPVLACAALCLMSTMNDITAPSITLEGRTIWLSQALPIESWQILKSKLNLHLLLTEPPVLLVSICTAIIIKATPAQSLLMVAAPLLFTAFYAAFGLIVNLKMPNLNWISETAAVKQSIGVLIVMMSGWVYALAFAGLYFLFGAAIGGTAFMAIFTIITSAALVGSLLFLKSKGSRIFASLHV